MPRIQRAGTILLGCLAVCAMSACAAYAMSHGPTKIKPAPQYPIEPPDSLEIQVRKAVPLKSYRIETYDVLKIQVAGTLEDQPIDYYYLVENDGSVNLGPTYGNVKLVGLSMEQATAAITRQLRGVVDNPRVSLDIGRCAEMTLIAGTYAVHPDGAIRFPRFGTVPVQGKTHAEAAAAINKHLSQFFQSVETEVAVDNGLCCVYTSGARLGDNCIRLRLTSSRLTVADILGQLDNVWGSLAVKIWVAHSTDNEVCGAWSHPAEKERGGDSALTIAWNSSTRGQQPADTVRLLPGDRVFVEEVPPPDAKAPEKVYRTTEPRRRWAGRRHRS